MKNKFKIVLFAVVIMFLFTSQSFGMGAAQKYEEKIRIGAVLPLTGKLSFLGDRVKKGIMLAEDILKKQGKNHIEIIFADSKSKPKEAVSASNKLIDINKVDTLIVLGTPMVNAVYPITERKKMPLIAQTIHPQITKKGSYIVQYFGSGSHEWKVLGEYINHRMLQNVVVFSMNSQYGEDCFAILKGSLNVKNITNIVHEFGEMNFSNIVAKYRNEIVNSDAIVFIGYASDFYNIIKTLNEQRIKNKLYLSTEAFLDERLLESKLIENAIAVVPRMQIEEYQTEEFRKISNEFKQKYDKHISFEAFYGFMDINLLAEVGVKNIETKLNNYKFNSISGEVTFVNREACSPVGIGIIKEGKIRAIK